MEVKTVAVLALLSLLCGATSQTETELLKISVGDPGETEVRTNITQTDSDWSQVTVERSFSIQNNEEGSREESDGEEPGKPRIIKRQIIKIPSGVTKVKVIAPNPAPQVRPKRMPPPTRVAVYGGPQRKRPTRRYPHKRPAQEFEEEFDEPLHHRIREGEGKRSKTQGKRSKVIVKEVTPEEFFSDDDVQQLPTTNVDAYQAPVKHGRKSHPRKPQKHVHYATAEDVREHAIQRPSRRPTEQDASYEVVGQEAEFVRPAKAHQELRPSPAYNVPEYEEYAASSIHMKQVPAPNLTGLNLIDPPDMMKEAKPPTYRTGKETSATEYVPKKAPTPRDIQSAFPPQYTSHNPHVVTNFGLDDGKSKPKAYSTIKHEYTEQKSYDPYAGGSVRYNQQMPSASEPQGVAVATGNSGLQVVQPPQFGTSQGSISAATETQRGNQRATIRDILQQDCPDYEMLGYCSSPPRYPTIQIANMAMKCPELLDVMNSPVPAEPQDDLTSFSRRSIDDVDIMFDDEANETRSDGYEYSEQWRSWSRSGSESETACSSEYTIIEPGYAREVTTGRWFVIVQNSDSSLQKVTTDTCLNPGKPCGGLAGMKCSRNRGFHNGIKSTRCIQRYTHQRLISWDPEAPNKCPRVRVFRFPTACVCHLRLM